ncbi:MAG TPA: hypothetical protein VEH84_18645 [Alphaproteobacteria bacterium]|nr:hypothetical protein [Alphaproteobacteria bacterium]
MGGDEELAGRLQQAAAALATAMTEASRAGLTVHLDFIERPGPGYAARVEVLRDPGGAARRGGGGALDG